jgi:hypothetical protein
VACVIWVEKCDKMWVAEEEDEEEEGRSEREKP